MEENGQSCRGGAPRQGVGGEKPSEPLMQSGILPLRYSRKEAEIKAIRFALQLTGWNRTRAARLLKISYRGLLYKIRQHNITRA